MNDPRYSHGYFVPVFSLGLLWLRRTKLAGASPRSSVWGFVFLAVGLGLHLAGGLFYVDWMSAVSILPSLGGLCLGLGGWKAWKWAWPAIAFLAFMLPLPFRVEVALAHPLQRLATQASTFVLQLIGIPAVAEGNIIVMEKINIGVVEACNGLGMLVTFFALATGIAIIVRRPPLDKLVVVLSAAPVALVANVVRITVTGLVAESFGKAAADAFFHDLAGWLLMPLALVLLWLELLLLSHLFIDRPRVEHRALLLPKPKFVPKPTLPPVTG